MGILKVPTPQIGHLGQEDAEEDQEKQEELGNMGYDNKMPQARKNDGSK